MHVAQRLGHLAALLIDREAVREHAAGTARARTAPRTSAASCGTSRGAGRSLRGTGPPALRISGRSRAHALERQARVGPHVHDVGDLLVVRPPPRRAAPPARARTRHRCRPRSTRAATASISSAVRGCSSPVCLCTNSAIGTPQVRWREMHQSGRLSIMPVMRCSPQAGVHCTCLMSRSACARRPVLLHADEPLRRGAEDHRRLVAPAVRIAVADSGSCVQQRARLRRALGDDDRVRLIDAAGPPPARVPGRKRPSLPDRVVPPAGRSAGRRRSPPGRAPGAVCTAPVPASSVTCSPRITGTSRVVETDAAASGPRALRPRSSPARSAAAHAIARQARLQQLRGQDQAAHALAVRAPRPARRRTPRAAPRPGWPAASRASSSR